MKYELSVIMPAIRTERWKDVYNSIKASFSGTWELVIITERKIPSEIRNEPNLKVIFSERSPMAKQQESLKRTEGEYITVMSDDSLWLPGALDRTFKETIPKLEDYKSLIVLKYLEGKEFEFPQWYIDQVADDMKFKTNYDFMRADKYYWTDTHGSSQMKGIPFHSPILSCAIYNRKLLFEVGGWDAIFGSQAIGNVDLAARLMYHGCKYIIQDFVSSTCGYMEQATSDHGAIHYCQILEDQPLIEQMYNRERQDRIIIDIDNWQNSDPIWKWKNPKLIEECKAKEAK